MADDTKQAKSSHDGSNRDFTKKQITNIDVGKLITAPIIAAAEGQEKLVNNYLDYITRLAFNKPKHSAEGVGKLIGDLTGVGVGDKIGMVEKIGSGVGKAVDEIFEPEASTKVMKFKLDRPVKNQDGTISNNSVLVLAPLLSLVPLPCFTMDEVTVDFTMEVHDQFTTKSDSKHEHDTDTKDDSSRGGGMFSWFSGSKGGNEHTEIKGKITSTSDSKRQTDSKATLKVFAKAVQQPPSEGMAKLTAIFSASIDALETNKRDTT